MSGEKKLKERFFFFQSGAGKLYASTHERCGAGSRTGVVFCSPFALEYIKVYRILFNLSRYLAHEGFRVLRFDYFGNGDSSGGFEDANADSYTRNVVDAIACIDEDHSLDEIILLGCRLGAAWALLAASSSKEDKLKKIILWDPVLDLKEYLYNQLRGNLSEQTMVYGKIVENRDRLVERILSGESVNVTGYPITKIFYEQARNINLLENPPIWQGQISVVLTDGGGGQRDKTVERFMKSYNHSFSLEGVNRVPAEFSWEISKGYATNPVRVFESVTKAVSGR